jgi:hypothetical protein
MTTAAQHGQDQESRKKNTVARLAQTLHDHDNPERTNTIRRTNACEKIVRTPHDHNEAAERCHVRFKQDIDPLSSIFDKSKATLINVFYHHSYPTAKKCKNDAPDNLDSPPTKCKNNKTSTDQQEKLRAALDPGNKILDKGEGKNNLCASFINNTMNTVSPPPKHATAGPKETAALLPGLAPPTLQNG